MRLVLTTLTLALTVALPGAAGVTAGNAHHIDTDHGCSLYVSIPNPCDPDSNN